MPITVKAMKMFLKSLPAQSCFQVISYGSNWNWLNNKEEWIEYNQPNFDSAKEKILAMRADYGGTSFDGPV